MTAPAVDKPLMLRYRGQPWGRAIVRHSHPCAICRNGILKGSLAYRPLSNCAFRGDRICLRCAKDLPQGATFP